MNTLTKDKSLKRRRRKGQKSRVGRRQGEKFFLECLKFEMRKLGATEADYALITPIMVKNALQNKRTPRDVAWAIMQ